MNLQQATNYIKQQLLTIYDRREAENITHILLDEYVGLSKTQRVIQAQQVISETQQTLINTALKLLLQHKPLQYILGYTWFCGNTFLVNEHVLIPRPETEELVDLVIKENASATNILDIGTGSGCIAISLQQKLQQAKVTAIDVSKDALSIAQQNAKKIGVAIELIAINFLDEIERNALPVFDIIVSNPPYITFEEKVDMRENVLHYEPHIALFAPNNNALIFYRHIAQFAKNHLSTNGKIYVEINETLATETATIFANAQFTTTIIKDLQGKDRMIKAVKC